MSPGNSYCNGTNLEEGLSCSSLKTQYVLVHWFMNPGGQRSSLEPFEIAAYFLDPQIQLRDVALVDGLE